MVHVQNAVSANTTSAQWVVHVQFMPLLSQVLSSYLVYFLQSNPSVQVQQAVQALIDKHQKIPGNILRALLERFQRERKED